MPTLLFDDDEADRQGLSDQGARPVDAASGPARGQLRRDIAKLASGADAAIRNYAPDPVQGTIRFAKDLAVGAAAGSPRAVYQLDDLAHDATDFVIGQTAKLLGKEQVEAVIRRNDADRAERIAALRPPDDEPFQGFVSDISEQLTAAYIGGALARGIGATGFSATGVGSIFAGGVVGKTTSDQLVKEGVDPLTAGLAGLQSAAINAAGAAAPGSLGGKLISRLGSGALLNSGFGIADRVATANLLKQNGYVEQAQSFEALAPEALALDLILGAGFAALDANGRSTDTRFAAQFGRDPSPEELDAAVHQIAIRDAQRSPLGVGLNGIAITAHERALERAIQQAASDEPINVGEFFEPRLRLGEDGPDELLDLAASERDNGRYFEAAALARLAQLRGAPIDTTGPYIEAARSLSREDQQASFDADLQARARDLDRETIAPDFLEIDRVEIDEAIQRVVHALHGDPEFRQIINDLSEQTIDPDDQTLIDLFRIQQRDGRDELLGSAAQAEFGTGTSFVDSGYVLPDGSLLKVPPGEHESVRAALDDAAQDNPIGAMLSDGAIRVNSLGATLSTRPTNRQLTKLVATWNTTMGRGTPLVIEVINPDTGSTVAAQRFERVNLEAVDEWVTANVPRADVLGSQRQLDGIGFFSAVEESIANLPAERWGMGWAAVRSSIAKGRGVDGYAGRVKDEIDYLGLDDAFKNSKLRGEELRRAVGEYVGLHKLVLDERFNRFDTGARAAAYQKQQAILDEIDRLKNEIEPELQQLRPQLEEAAKLMRAQKEAARGEYLDSLEAQVRSGALSRGEANRRYEEFSPDVPASTAHRALADRWRAINDRVAPAIGALQRQAREVMQGVVTLAEEAGIRRGPGDLRLPGDDPVFDLRLKLPPGTPGADFKSHWSRAPSNDDGVLVSVRGEERIDDAGKRTLFGGEVQSDLAQANRKAKERGEAGIPAPLTSRTSQWTSAAVRAMVFRAARDGFDSVSFPTSETSTLIQGNNSAASHYDTNVRGALEKVAALLGGQVREGGVEYRVEARDWAQVDPSTAERLLKSVFDRLPASVRLRLRTNLAIIKRSESGEFYVSHKRDPRDADASSFPVSHWNYVLRNEAGNNPIVAAYNIWVQGAVIFDEPGAFERMLEVAAEGDTNVSESVRQAFGRASIDSASAYVLDITPQMREQVLRQGFPLFGSQQITGSSTARVATERLKADLGRAFGVKATEVDRLIEQGRLAIFDTVTEAETVLGRSVGNVAGGYLPNSDRAFLIADRVAPDQAYRVVLHEVGVHAGIGSLLGETRWAQLQEVLRDLAPQTLRESQRFRDLVTTLQQAQGRNAALTADEIARLAQEHDVNPAIVRAWAEAEAFAVKGYEAEEALAYLVENAPDLPLVRRLLAQIRQWLWRTFGPDFGPRLTIDDLQALAVAALRRESRLAERNRLTVEGKTADAEALAPDYLDENNLLASFANARTPDQRARLGQELEPRTDGRRQLYVWRLNNQDFALTLTARADINGAKSNAPVRVAFGALHEGNTLDLERQNFGDLFQAEQNLQNTLAGLERDIREHQRRSYVFVATDAGLERLYARLALKLDLPESYVLARQEGVFAIIRADEVARTLGGKEGALASAVIQTTEPVEPRFRTHEENDDLQAGARGDLRIERQKQDDQDISAAGEIARDDPELETPLLEFGSPQPFRAREVMQLLALQRRAADQLGPAFDVAAACAFRNGWGFADKNAPFTLIDHPRVQGLLVSQVLVLAGGLPLGLGFWEKLFLNGQTPVLPPRIAGELEEYKSYLKKSEIERNPGFRREEPRPNPIPSRLELAKQKASNLALVDTNQPLASLAMEAGNIVGIDGGWLEKLALKESGGKADAQPIYPNTGELLSSATGLTQFIDSTWIDVMSKYGADHGFRGDLRDPEDQQRALALRTNPIWSLVMAAHLAKDNARALRNSLGRDATEKELYLAHFAGVDGALTLIKADDQELAPTVMASEARANPGLYFDSSGAPRTIGQVKERLGKNFAATSLQSEQSG